LEIHTIGFTKRSAADFFGTLDKAGVEQIIDVRLRNNSQLAGFTKREDLAFFVRKLLGGTYREVPTLAPTAELLDGLKKHGLPWEEFERGYNTLLIDRRADEIVPRNLFDTPSVLLCSEFPPQRCHRRLAAEFLQAKWGNLSIVHL
jgi:uncharacterized protein (DUF488 family)